ncbi:uncharacterized protein DAT39_023033, partial [Clarias magur]
APSPPAALASMSCVSADMWTYTLLFGLQILNFSLPVSGEGSVTAKLHHPVTLTCHWNCSGLLKWTQYHKPRYVVSQCDQSSCRSEEGFNIAHDQYLEGKPYLTITAADYSNTGLYCCHCEDKVICQVDLNIETQKRSHVVIPGEPVDVHLPLTDQVEVSFTASGATQPSNLEICNMTRGRMECKPDYRATVSHLNILQIKVVNASHSGTYTVRDSMKKKTIAIVKVEVRGSTAAMMRLCTSLILMLALYQVDSSDTQKVFGNLHETSSLPCPQSCSGLLTWTMFQRPDDVLVRCTRDSCWRAAGFSLNHDEFLRGDSTLTVLRADYSLRGLYRAECDSETLCQVVFTLNPNCS